MGDPLRLRILQLLFRSEMTVTEIVSALKANQPNISKHLQLLLQGKLVARRKVGVKHIYSVADPLIYTFCDLACRGIREKARTRLTEAK